MNAQEIKADYERLSGEMGKVGLRPYPIVSGNLESMLVAIESMELALGKPKVVVKPASPPPAPSTKPAAQTITETALTALSQITPEQASLLSLYESVAADPIQRAKLFALKGPELMALSRALGRPEPKRIDPSTTEIEGEYMACRDNPIARAKFIEKHGAKKLLALARESLRR